MVSAEDYYDSIAEGYDELYGEEQLEKFKFILSKINLSRDYFALDVGCGSGIITKELSKYVKKVVGIDISSALLKIAEKKRKARNVEYLKADATSLPFEDKSFEVVFSFTVFQDVEDKEKFLSEIARVCKFFSVVSFLKRGKDLDSLKALFSKYFDVLSVYENNKDYFFVLKPKFVCNPLPRNFFERKAEVVAKDLLGKYMVYKGCIGKIVETEAYYGKNDPASRAFKGKNKVSAPMFEEAGTILVYMVHNNWLLNFVTGKKGNPQAVLIRAVEPIEGIDLMKKRRGRDSIVELCNGPGKLTQAFGITRELNFEKVGEELLVCDGFKAKRVGKSKRIGVSADLDRDLRFFIKGNRFVSKFS